MVQNRIGVTVGCTVYNHEKYLRKCLDGFVMQKTTFPFEVIVHDDASTDRSPEIIREYAEKYPELIKPIFQKENQYSQNISITRTYIFPMVRGKYYASCEGDDYWCDENKLQKQYDAMEANPNCLFCAHKVQLIAEDGHSLGIFYPKVSAPSGVLQQKDFLERVLNSYPFQTSSYFRRYEIFKEQIEQSPEFIKIAPIGDVPTMLYCASFGPAYYIDEVMSCYRTNSIGSWNMRVVQNKEKFAKHCDAVIEMYKQFNVFTESRYSQLVDRAIWGTEMYKKTADMDRQERARTILKEKKRDIFKHSSKKGVVALYLQAYAPWAFDFLYQMKGKAE